MLQSIRLLSIVKRISYKTEEFNLYYFKLISLNCINMITNINFIVISGKYTGKFSFFHNLSFKSFFKGFSALGAGVFGFFNGYRSTGDPGLPLFFGMWAVLKKTGR